MILTHIVLFLFLDGAGGSVIPPAQPAAQPVNDSQKHKKPYRSIYSIQERAEEAHRLQAKVLPEVVEALVEAVEDRPAPIIEQTLERIEKTDPALLQALLQIADAPQYDPAAAVESPEEKTEIEPEVVPAPKATAAPIEAIEATPEAAPEIDPHDEADDEETMFAILAVLQSMGLT